MVRATVSIVLLLIVVGLVTDGRADDWPQYRGPKRDWVSRETGLLKTWPKGGPKLLWTYRDAGAGFSPPSIVGNHFYCMGSKDKDDVVFALDTQTGKLLWTASAGPRRLTDWGDGPTSTPTVDGDYLYAISILGELHCINRHTGKHVWHVHLKNDLQGKILHDGRYCESPLVDGDRVICSPGGKEGTFAAFDKKTGKLLWRSKELTDEAVSSSTVLVIAGGVRQYVNLTGKGVAGVAAKDGRLLWKSDIPAAHIMVTTPVHADGHVFVTAGYGRGCGLLKLSADGERTKAEEVYRNKVMKNHHGGVVLVDGHLYGHSDPNGWVCMDFKTGKLRWEETAALGKGSLTCADGRLYCYGEKTGTLVLVEADPTEWKEAGRFTIPEKTKVARKEGLVWTPPVVANGRLYLRDQDLLFCYDLTAPRRP